MLLLDEPLSNLDARLRVRMREEIKRIQRRVGITSVFVTHDQEEALSVADRIAVMHQGRLEQVDTPAAVYDRPQTLFVADFIGRMNLLEADLSSATARSARGCGPAARPDGASWPMAALTVAIRPEDLRLGRSPDATPLAAIVDVVMDLGHYRQISLQAQPFGTLMMIMGKKTPINPGNRVPVSPFATWCITAGRGTPEGGAAHFATGSDPGRTRTTLIPSCQGIRWPVVSFTEERRWIDYVSA